MPFCNLFMGRPSYFVMYYNNKRTLDSRVSEEVKLCLRWIRLLLARGQADDVVLTIPSCQMVQGWLRCMQRQ